MGMMEKFMGMMMGRMSKEDKEAMMSKMTDKFFEGMTKEDKQKMMNEMMPKMMEGMNMMDMMSGMMTNGGMMGMMSGMMGSPDKMEMPPMMKMMEEMMPHCLQTMIPYLPKEQRKDFALKITDGLLNGMSGDEKEEFLKKVGERIKVGVKT